MKKVVTIFLLLGFTNLSFSQNNPRPSASRFWLNKAATFQMKAGDILIYEVKKDGETYDFIATVKKYGETINFEWAAADKNINGSAIINAASLKSGAKYNNIFTNTDNSSNDKGSLWLSTENYRALASSSKQAKLDFGKGLRTFKRETTTTQKIQYKGSERIVTMFKATAKGDEDVKEFWVLNDLTNPLIVKIDGAATINLKEVR